jgi:hypothetical protein
MRKIEAPIVTLTCKFGETTLTVTRMRNGKPPVAKLQREGEEPIEAPLIYGEPLAGFDEEESRAAFTISDSLSSVHANLANSESMHAEIERARERRRSERPHA